MAYQARRIVEAEQPDVAVPSAPRRGARRAKGLRARPAAQGVVGLVGLAVLATSGAIVLGVNGGSAAAAGSSPSAVIAEPTLTARALTADSLAAPAAVRQVVAPVVVSKTRLYSTGSLNVRAEADTSAKLLGSISRGAKISATSSVEGKYRQIEFEDGYGWVLAASLSDESDSPVPDGTTMDPCPRGSAVENRLRPKTIYIYRSVCPLFPEINSFGGWRAGGRQFHKNGRALDLMLTTHVESKLGWRITKYLIAHYREFNIDHIIFEQQIWTPSNQRWRKMVDRGSLNANHFNHVHVAIKA
ncbi:SH3 domain-containing protein [Propionicimonas paludicola]|uniref:SH3 domain-containing protein n=1 Tax=Propionicimonas paludicola TaxID=185243 RepID=A0A2A9CUM9_9ACTN|nr:SH3 domain-containing protein [Propionicimonas paludicola]PFG17846.1 SH3 domain-containing protein [Propionicimonas paludicola]